MFAMTKEERQVILFLLAVGITGLGIQFYLKTHCREKLVYAGEFSRLGKINLNKADKATLQIIPGIGEKLSERIIDYRAQHQGFLSVEELKTIKGITGKRYEIIQNSLYIE